MHNANDQDYPSPPYDVIIFTAKLKSLSEEYIQRSNELYELIKKEEGFYGSDLALSDDLELIVHYYWKDLNLISIWEEINSFMNEKSGDEMKWFEHYKMRIGRVEREFEVLNEIKK